MLNNFVQLQISCYTLNAVRSTLYSNTLYAARYSLYATRSPLFAFLTCSLCSCALCTFLVIVSWLLVIFLVSSCPRGELIMQNKANLQNAQINITPLLTKEYENIRLYRRDENKPNQTQFKSNFNPKLALFSEILALFGFQRKKAQLSAFLQNRVNIYYFVRCIFRLLCYNIAKWRFNLSSLKSKPPIKLMCER